MVTMPNYTKEIGIRCKMHFLKEIVWQRLIIGK